MTAKAKIKAFKIVREMIDYIEEGNIIAAENLLLSILEENEKYKHLLKELNGPKRS